MAFTYVTIQNVFETADDQPARGRVEFTPVDRMHNGNTVISATVYDDLDPASGAMSIRVAATTDPSTTPVGVTYRVVERIAGQPTRTYYVSVPHNQGSTLQLANLTPLSASGAAGFALRNAVDYDDSTPPTDGQAMVWDTPTGKFRPETVAGGGGGAVSSVNGQTGAVTVSPASIGAQPADSDLTAIAALAPTDGSLIERVGGAWTARTSTQVKGDLGLDQVTNTSDAAKPVSTATQAALNLKAPLADPAFTGTPTAPRFVGAAATATYAAALTLNAAQATTYKTTATGDITSVTISNGTDGQSVRLQVLASGADRTVTAFGVATLVPSGTWGSLGWTYNQSANVWIQDRSSVTGGGGGGAVSSVNGQTGAVVITAASLGAQPIDSDLTAIGDLAPADGSTLSRQGGVWTARTGAQVKTDLALNNVDNTSDANKPLSTAATTALNLKAPLASPTFTGTAAAPRFVGAVQTVTYAASVTLNASLASTFRVTATGNLVVADITNGVDGQEVALEVLASGAVRTLTVAGLAFDIPAGQVSRVELAYNSGTDTWYLDEGAAGGTGGGGGGGVSTPADGSVTNAKVAVNAAIDLDKTADSATRLAMSATERTKLAGVAAGATVNSTDAQLRDRSTHTGTQPVSSLATTGTASATTFLRGDAAFADPSLVAPLVNALGNSGSAVTLDAASAAGWVKTLTLTANCTFTLTGASSGRATTLEVVLTQDATGGRAVTWPASVRWAGGAPSLSTAANAVDRIVLTSYNGGTNWYGDLIGKGYV